MVLKFLFLNFIYCCLAQSELQLCISTGDCDTLTDSPQTFQEIYIISSRPILQLIEKTIQTNPSLQQIFRVFSHSNADGTQLYKLIFITINGFYEAYIKLMRDGSTRLLQQNKFQKMENQDYYPFEDPEIEREIGQMLKQNRTLANLEILDAFISGTEAGPEIGTTVRKLKVFLLGPSKSILEVSIIVQISEQPCEDEQPCQPTETGQQRLNLNILDTNVQQSLIILRATYSLISNSRLVNITQVVQVINRIDYHFTTPQKVYTAFFEADDQFYWITFFIVINIRANPIVIARSPALASQEKGDSKFQPSYNCIDKQQQRYPIYSHQFNEFPQTDSGQQQVYYSPIFQSVKIYLNFCGPNGVGTSAQISLISSRIALNSTHRLYIFFIQQYLNYEQQINQITVIVPSRSINIEQDFEVNQLVIDLLSNRYIVQSRIGLQPNQYANQTQQCSVVFEEVKENLKANFIPITGAPLTRLYTFTYYKDGIQRFRRFFVQYRFRQLQRNQRLREFAYDKNLQTGQLTFLFTTNMSINEQYLSLGQKYTAGFLRVSDLNSTITNFAYDILYTIDQKTVILTYFEGGIFYGAFTNLKLEFLQKIPQIDDFLDAKRVEEGQRWFQTKLAQIPLPYSFAMQYVRKNQEVSKLVRQFEASFDLRIRIFKLILRKVQLVNVTKQQYWYRLNYSNGEKQPSKLKYIQATLAIPRYEYTYLNVSFTVQSLQKYGISGQVLLPGQIEKQYPNYISTFTEQIYKNDQQNIAYFKFKDGSIYQYRSSQTLQAIKCVKDFNTNTTNESLNESISSQQLSGIQKLCKQLGFPDLDILSVRITNAENYTGIRLLYLEIKTQDSKMYDMIYKKYEKNVHIIPLSIKAWEFWQFSFENFIRCNFTQRYAVQMSVSSLFKGQIKVTKAYRRQIAFSSNQTRYNYLIQIVHMEYGRFEIFAIENESKQYRIYSLIHLDAGFTMSGVNLISQQGSFDMESIVQIEQETRKKLDQFFFLISSGSLQNKFKRLILWKIVAYSPAFFQAEFYYEILDADKILQIRVTKHEGLQPSLIFFKMITHQLTTVTRHQEKMDEPPKNMRNFAFIQQCQQKVQNNYEVLGNTADLVSINEYMVPGNLIGFDFIFQTADNEVINSTAIYDLIMRQAKRITIKILPISHQSRVQQIAGCIKVDKNQQCEICDSRYYESFLGFCVPSLLRCAIKSDSVCIQCLFGYTVNMFSDFNKCIP